ncbi:MAG: hypothetical protein IJN63_10485 [Clostridia bacterium]|nr:hypothetical protein [Clostridia bacterium]
MKKTLLKNIALVLISSMLTATLVVGGTVAYLQDTDSDVNVMTVGNVYIEQNEYERVVENGAYKVENGSYVLKEFSQAKPLYPATELDANGNPYNHGAGNWDTTTVDMSQVGSQGLQKVFTSKNAQDKIVTVKNTGKSDAYVRTWIALEDPFTEGRIGVNVGNKDYYTQTSWTTVEIDGVQYSVSCFTYKEALKPGEVSTPSLFQVYLNYKATNEDMELLGNSYEILAFSQAVQTAGFADAATALTTAFGSDHPWKNTVIVAADNEAELLNALASGKDVILNTDIVEINETEFNGNEASVTLAGTGDDNYGYLAFVPEKGEDAKVENLTVTGTGFVEVGHYGVGGGDYEINNLVLKNMSATLGVRDGANYVAPVFCHYGNAVMKDCVMTGATGTKAGYTAYDAGFVNGTHTTINGGEYGKIYLWSQAHVTIYDAEIDTIDSAAITTKNLGKLTIGAGTHVGTINLVPGTYTPALVIEDDATVDAIVYKGVTYTQAQWLSANP